MADEVNDDDVPVKALDEDDIVFLKHYGMGPYAASIRQTENDVKEILTRVNGLTGVKESDTGLAPPSRWDLASDKQMMQEEQPLQVWMDHAWVTASDVTSVVLHQVARCTKIINQGTDDAKYVINVKQIAKFVVSLGERVAPTDIEEGMRVGYDGSLSFVSVIGACFV